MTIDKRLNTTCLISNLAESKFGDVICVGSDVTVLTRKKPQLGPMFLN